MAMNDEILDTGYGTKTSTTAVDTFKEPNFGELGYIHNGDAVYLRSPERHNTKDFKFDISKVKILPKVGIVYNYSNASDLPVKALIDIKFDGIVSTGVGNGNIYKGIFEQFAKASKDEITVVRSSRVPTGATTLQQRWMIVKSQSS